MHKIILALFLFSTVVGCGNKKQETAAVAETNSDAPPVSKTFFPVTSFLKGQLAELDSIQVTPLLITVENGKVDSLWLNEKATIKEFVKPFFLQTIDTANLRNLFRATKFNDQTINAITFTYDPVAALPDSIKLKNWNIYINPETGEINKVYMLVEDGGNDKLYTQQLTWKTGYWAKITTLSKKQNGANAVKEQKLVWGFNEQPAER
jgi:hypothetical protein